jgi:NADPH:quinone reductase-like Zn-dependent oxidoreductase
MKAIVLKDFGGPEMMELADVDTPSPKGDQILIKVMNASVNRPDVIQRQGNYPPPPGDSEILGLEVAGTIEAVGADATRFKVGDRVVALVGGGGYAEYALAYEEHAMTIPDSVSGGVATSAIQLCRALSPETEIFVTASSGKLDRVREQGAHHVIDYREQDFAGEIRRITEKRGVDVILDHIGAKYLEANMKSLALAGTLMLIGVMGGIKAELNLATMMVKRQRIIGSVLRSRPVTEKAAIINQFEAAVDGTGRPFRQDRARQPGRLNAP